MSSVGKRQPSGKKYWRSLDDLAQTPEFRDFMHREFPAGASELLEGNDRRHFLKIMGASMALAGMGLTGCRRWPTEEIAPFASRPIGRVPGLPRHYATSMEMGGIASAVLATSFDGRPTKIEGNPDHPMSLGGTSVFSQASVLDLYDPDRSRKPMLRNEGRRTSSTWEAFNEWSREYFDALRNVGGAGLRILAEASDSPTVGVMKQRLLEEFPQARWHEWEPITNDNDVNGSLLAFGAPYRAQVDYSATSIIVSLGADLLGMHPAAVKNIREFASTRRAEDEAKTMSRLYVFESHLSLTGANADHRSAVRAGDVGAVAAWLARRVLNEESLDGFEHTDGIEAVFTDDLLENLNLAFNDLQTHRGTSVVVVGAEQPAEVHYLAALMNEALGNVGATVSYTSLGQTTRHLESLTQLVADMKQGEVDTLLILGGNPVYDAPADLDFVGGLKEIRASIHLSHYDNETSSLCNWHLNRAHYLEAWGDGRSWDGTFTLCQPLIEPLFLGRSVIELLALLSGDATMRGYDLVRRTFSAMTGMADYERAWRRSIHDGFLAGSALVGESPRVNRGNLALSASQMLDRWSNSDHAGWELVYVTDPCVYDGRYANNGWLQELPDPITKVTWDNTAVMSPASAAALKVRSGDLVTLSVGDYAVQAPVMIVPGIADRTVVISLGYGRDFKGRICTDAGFNAYGVRTTAALHAASGVMVQKARGTYPLATTQDHHAIDLDSVGGQGLQKRLPTLIREAELSEYREHPEFAKHRTHVTHRLSMFGEEHAFHTPANRPGAVYAWGMSIDLTACVGCNACIMACQAENNIPIVGKDQIIRGREMHWIRIDRYYTFAGKAGAYDVNRLRNVYMQPVACQMCENAPCEQVCPVAATTHDSDGLNVMVYNRCIGTRYCSNNCPYKVRRFNFFDYHRREPHRETGLFHVNGDYYRKEQADAGPLKSMQFNPEVTVRMRGVMEKCTYCLQRISSARIEAKNEWVKTDAADRPERPVIADGSLTTACAQACPAGAIVFGDLNDPLSRVTALHRDDRSYEMLEEINVKPRTQYLAKLRNPATDGASHEASQVEAPEHG